MKKSHIVLFVLLVLVGIGVAVFFFNSSKNNNSSLYNAEKTASNNSNNTSNSSSESDNRSENSSNNRNSAEGNGTTSSQTVPVFPEIEIASFSTKIYTKESSRQNNISITCSTLNDTIVEKGSTFSFCDTVGKATSDKGYEKANVFKSDGTVTKGLGGGNCQVSTTLYNAVLTIPELTVIERHEHSGDVPYIDNGKDAAVAYGSYDFKFVNNLDSSIRIEAENTENNITIKLIKIS